MSDITPTDEQNSAIKAITTWYGDKSGPQEFYLAGYAGVGKSTIANVAIEELAKQKVKKVRTAAFTGKAASVLRKKGIPEAQTIHSLIYKHKIDKKNGKVTFSLSSDSDAADADLIVLDECFSGDTIVDTPAGSVYIRDLEPGDEILNAWGVDNVVAVMKKEADHAVQVKFSGETITCSAYHRFFTTRGLVPAAQLRSGDALITVAESMRLLRDELLAEELGCSLLYRQLQHALVAPIPILPGTDIYRRTEPEVRRSKEGMARLWSACGDKGIEANFSTEPIDQSRDKSQNQRRAQGEGASATEAGRQRSGVDECPREVAGLVGAGMGDGIRNFAGASAEGVSHSLQNGPGQPGQEDRNRIGRPIASFSIGTGKGPKKGGTPASIRVESVEVLEPGDPRLDRVRDADGKLYLYDIQAKRHSSFAVNGALVHNCSMVDDAMANDLRSFGKKILIMGDPGQLPPVKGAGAFTNRQPDVFLREIHRQSAESPILELATLARQGKPLPLGYSKGGVNVLPLNKETQEMIYSQQTQAICGLNRVRWVYTQRIRKKLGYEGQLPVVGERLICCKNNKQEGFFNGSLAELKKFRVDAATERFAESYVIDVKIEDEKAQNNNLTVDPYLFKNHFSGGTTKKIEWVKGNPRYEEFDWGYVLTCHKAQGSSWSHVTVIDDSESFRENAATWKYTAITRAEESLTVLVRDAA